MFAKRIVFYIIRLSYICQVYKLNKLSICLHNIAKLIFYIYCGMIFDCHNLEELNNIALKLLTYFKEDRVFAFFGKMGVGKTTFIKEICKVLEVHDVVCSPTFSIVNEYITSKRGKIYHFDFYRIKNLQEAYDIGYEEYFYSGNYCFIEWSENIEQLLPANYVQVKIEEQLLGQRKIIVEKI